MLDITRRAWRNLVRIPGRTLLLVLVLGAIVGLAVTGLAVLAGAQAGLSDAKLNMGNEVQLVPNFTAARRAGLRGLAQPDTPGIPETLVDSLTASTYVAAGDRAVTGLAASPDLAPVRDESADLPQGFALVRELMGGFQIAGNSLPAEALGAGRSQRELVEGRLYTADEVATAAAVAVIDENLAEKNGLGLGSLFTLQNRDGGDGLAFTVIGLTRDVTPPEEEIASPSPGRMFASRFNLFQAANQILMPYTAAQTVTGKSGEVSSATFYLKAPEDLDPFRAEAEGMGIDPEQYVLVADDVRAERAAAPFEAVEGFARAGVVALVVVGALVVVLLMSLITRERKLEIGVLRALGAGRGSVAAQFVIETTIVCLIALCLGGLVGGLAAQNTAESLLGREAAAMEREPAGRTTVLPGGISIITEPSTGPEGETPDITVRFGWQQVAALLGIGLILAVSGSVAAVYWGMKMEPASILTSRN